MNQEPRRIKMTCMICRESTVWTRQVYNVRISDYETVEPPICEECRRKEWKHGKADIKPKRVQG